MNEKEHNLVSSSSPERMSRVPSSFSVARRSFASVRSSQASEIFVPAAAFRSNKSPDCIQRSSPRVASISEKPCDLSCVVVHIC